MQRPQVWQRAAGICAFRRSAARSDVAIIGGGALGGQVGLAAAWQCPGFKRVLMFEECPFLKQRGSPPDFCRMGSAGRVIAHKKVLAKTVMPRRSRAGEGYWLSHCVYAAQRAMADKMSCPGRRHPHPRNSGKTTQARKSLQPASLITPAREFRAIRTNL